MWSARVDPAAGVRNECGSRVNTYDLPVIPTAHAEVGALQGLQGAGAGELMGQHLGNKGEMHMSGLARFGCGNTLKMQGLTAASRTMWNLRYCTSFLVLAFLKRKSCCSCGSPRMAVSVGQKSVTGLWMGSLISPSRLFFCNTAKIGAGDLCSVQ